MTDEQDHRMEIIYVRIYTHNPRDPYSLRNP